ncbi:Rho termination factor N-terminal domain-containing protein, partial [Nocardia pseudovaccinii]|uniref:Rho termination factor N-terminal domain-containing protein n=1 Tax=Nocardia pseudovaccinii TaxID=189540 RepID=UPI001C3FB4DC
MTDTDLLATPGVDSNPAGDRESDSGQISKMSEQTDVARSGLTGMLLPQLRALAGELGIRGTSGMRKGDLIAAIKENQAGKSAKAEKSARGEVKSDADAAKAAPVKAEQGTLDVTPAASAPAKEAPAPAKEAQAKDAPAKQAVAKEAVAESAAPKAAEKSAESKSDQSQADAASAETAEDSGREGGQRGRG